MSTFPHSRKSKRGYNVDEVTAFLERARQAYDAAMTDAAPLTATEIRHTAFSMKKGGFSPEHVDAAMERLEDAFALRERESTRAQKGDEAWYSDARSTAQVILDRLDRPQNHRFRRTSLLSHGYNRAEVDRFAKRLSRYFQEGKPMSIAEVRTVVFRPQRRGYSELQVDLLLDSVTEVMLAVR